MKYKSRKTKTKDIELPQTSVPTEHVTDKAVNDEMDEKTTKTSQDHEITSSKKRVKRLKKKRRSRTHELKRLYKVGLSARVESSADEESLSEEVIVEKEVVGKDVSVVKEVNAASIATSVTATTTTTGTTPTISMDEITLAKALIEIKKSRPKAKGIIIKLQEEIYKQERLIGERARQEEEANNALIETWEDIQAKNTDGWKPRALKNKSFAEVKELFDKAIERINNFIDFRTELVEESTKKDKTMFEHHAEDNVWKNQQGLTKVKSWKLFDSCGVHCVKMKNILYYLLVEKMYPLTSHTLHQLFNNVKLQFDNDCEMAYKDLRLVKK
nr:hypothetical protein [Tanacetum cinerariifolium]